MSIDTDIQQCLHYLNNGGVIVYPTDTVWGLGCDATNAAAVARIFEIKKRADEKAMIVLLPNERSLLQYVASLDLSVFDYLDTVQKPTTVIYENAIGLAANLTAPDGSVGIRICKTPFCNQLLNRFKKPLVSTSANISGTPAPANFSEINPEILQLADYVVQQGQDDTTIAAPSSVIRWLGNGNITVLRN